LSFDGRSSSGKTTLAARVQAAAAGSAAVHTDDIGWWLPSDHFKITTWPWAAPRARDLLLRGMPRPNLRESGSGHTPLRKWACSRRTARSGFRAWRGASWERNRTRAARAHTTARDPPTRAGRPSR